MREKAHKQSAAEQAKVKADRDRAYDVLVSQEQNFQALKAELQNLAQADRWPPARYEAELRRHLSSWPSTFTKRIPHIVASHATWLKAPEPSQPFAQDSAWFDAWLQRMTAKQDQP